MPLIEGKSQKSFKKNVGVEMEAGKPQKQSLAIAYAMKRKAEERDRHKSHGGMMHDYAMGGYAHGGMEHCAEGGEMEEECKDCMAGHCDVHGHDMLEDDNDIVQRIMHKGLKKMSEGGRVANQEHGPEDEDLADFSRNEFDDLVLDDDLHENYTGANSGDEVGDEQEDEDRHDIVSRIMRARHLKDRMPIAGYGSGYGRNK